MDTPNIAAALEQPKDSMPDHRGIGYLSVLKRMHDVLAPTSYLEIGTNTGDSLTLATCSTIAVDPKFRLGGRDVIGKKPLCVFFQETSDKFFQQHDLKRILNGSIDMAFLDGMHHCEYLLRDFANTERHSCPHSMIALHDCVPVDLAIAGRTFSQSRAVHRAYWWAGDVWRTLLALQKYRPDLSFTVLDAQPTGLVLITNLDPDSKVLIHDYASIVREMMSLSLAEIGLEQFFAMINLQSTSVLGEVIVARTPLL